MSEDELLAAQGGAPKKKKKKKKKPKVDEYGNAITPNVDGEPVKKKKKKKKPKAEDEDAGNIVTKPGESDGPPVKKKKKKKKKAAATTSENGTTDLLDAGVTSDGHDGVGYAPVAVAASATSAFATRNTDDDSQDEKAIHRLSYNDDYDDAAVKQKVDDADVIVADTSPSQDAFYPNVDVDADVMAEVQQDGIVQVDASGGIQAFVAETIAVDGDDVGIIKSDAEIETEEKKRYTKYFLGAVACMVVVIAAVAVPLTLTYAKGRSATRFITVTEQPTDVPSLMPSLMPSSQPSSLRFRAIVSKLKPLSGDALNVPGSPQYNAAMWISDKDELNLDLSNGGFEQRYIMALFYYAMDGNNWNQKQGWLTGESECYWFGIDGNARGCGDDGVGGCIARGDFVGDYDKICRLDMGRLNNLYGNLPSELGSLTEMRYFEIQDDYILGTLPQSLGNWKQLHTFLIGGNYISGGFPSTFEGNEMLGTIFIDRNRFNSTFPNVFSTLKNLEWLDAEQNGFKGSLPASITRLKRLRILNLNNNSLTGYLPDKWDENNLIEDFEVANNDLTGPLPPTLANAKFLKDVRLSRNQLTGDLPTSYYNFENLEELYLDENMLTGEFPQTPEPFYDGLQELSIHSNDFEGPFPFENFENTLRVKVLELQRNNLEGVVPKDICDRKDPSRAYTRLVSLAVDCDEGKIDCDCCTCYLNGTRANRRRLRGRGEDITN